MEKRKIITGVLVALLFGAAARADLMPAAGSGAGPRPRPLILRETVVPPSNFSHPWDGFITSDLSSLPARTLSDEFAPTRQPLETPHLYILADRQSGISLCLCALLGLGLCKAAPCVKKFSWGAIPAWYHDGGPYQIGHSLAVAPDCICPAPMCHLISPNEPFEEPPSPYEEGILLPWWPKSQFFPCTLAARGPPARW